MVIDNDHFGPKILLTMDAALKRRSTLAEL